MDGRIGNFATDFPMKDMAMVVAPVAVVVYFICFPDQLGYILEWLVRLTDHIH
jgi:hypothetical protein